MVRGAARVRYLVTIYYDAAADATIEIQGLHYDMLLRCTAARSGGGAD